MIQRIAPHVYHNEYTPQPPQAEDIVFIFRDREIYALQDPEAGVSFPQIRALPGGLTQALEAYAAQVLVFLFRLDDHSFYLLRTWEEAQLPAGFSFENTFYLRRMNPQLMCFAGMTALHLAVWYRDNRFCGRCGHPTALHHIERALSCTDPACTNIIYPRISPAVIVGVTWGDRILVTRYRDRPYRGMSLVAGFCEIGEEAEQTVAREVLEETGVHVDHIRYYATQPWGFDGNLLLGYYCEAVDPEVIRPDGEELAVAEWIPRSEINTDGSVMTLNSAPADETNVTSLTLTMILHFRDHPEDFASGRAR